jgi:dephospho-CoA kinase
MKKVYEHPLVVAITGGIGTGQSTVCEYFQEWNCKIINADSKAKDIINRNRSLQKDLQKEFGKDIIVKGKLNRKRLAEVAFKDEFHTGKLNRMVHPRMVESLVEEMEKARFSKRFPIIVVDAALVYEISIERNFEVVIVVKAPMEQRRKRVYLRDGMTRQQFKERVEKQIPIEDKAKWADMVIDNNGSLDDLKIKSMRVFNKLIELQKKKERKLGSS